MPGVYHERMMGISEEAGGRNAVSESKAENVLGTGQIPNGSKFGLVPARLGSEDPN
jgi:hypothetical protein